MIGCNVYRRWNGISALRTCWLVSIGVRGGECILYPWDHGRLWPRKMEISCDAFMRTLESKACMNA